MRVSIYLRKLRCLRGLSLILVCVWMSSPAFAFDDGEKCTSVSSLEPNQTCFQNEVYSCPATDRMGYIACGEVTLQKLRLEAKQRYERLLKRYDRPDAEGMSFAEARTTLRNAQKAWEQLADAECDLEESLFGSGGNANAGVMFDCAHEHAKEWIRRLTYYEKLGYFQGE